jgi:hypothetical protein
MGKIRFITIALSICLLAACAPSAQAIQTAIAQTQAAIPTKTPNPNPTSTLTPTVTLTIKPTLTSSLTSLPTTVPVMFYSDDFSSDRNWLQSNGSGAMFQYSGGQYIISRPKGNYVNWACANRSLTDTVLAVDVLVVSGDFKQTGPVFLWRYVDTNNHYYLQITGAGYYVFDKKFYGKWQTQSSWLFSDAIKRGKKVNRITIAFSNGTSALYINNKYVRSMQDSDFTKGDICLGAASSDTSEVEVSFDNLVIYTYDSWTPPKQ